MTKALLLLFAFAAGASALASSPDATPIDARPQLLVHAGPSGRVVVEVYDSTPARCTEAGLSFTPAQTVTGTSGPDVLVLGNQGQLALALAGDDKVSGGNGKDCIDGGPGNDKLAGDNGKDVILGGDGDDFLYGGNGADVLDGGAGFDVCVGGNGQDTIINCEFVVQGDQDAGDGCDSRQLAGLGSGKGDDDDCEDDDEDDECRDREDFMGSGAGDNHSGDDDECDDDDEDEECRGREDFTGSGAGDNHSGDDDDCDDDDDISQDDSVANKSIVGPSDATVAPEPPQAPVDVAAAADATTITLSWQPVEGAGYYNIYRSDVSGVGHEGVGSSNGTSFVDVDVAPGATYYYIMTTVGLNKAQSRDSKEVVATLASPTPAPGTTPSPTSTTETTASHPPTATPTDTPTPGSSKEPEDGPSDDETRMPVPVEPATPEPGDTPAEPAGQDHEK